MSSWHSVICRTKNKICWHYITNFFFMSSVFSFVLWVLTTLGYWFVTFIEPLNSYFYGLPRRHSGEESACQCGDTSSTPGSERSPGKGNGNPLQYSCLENPMNRGAWQATVHRVTKSQTWLDMHAQNHGTHRNPVSCICRLVYPPPRWFWSKSQT